MDELYARLAHYVRCAEDGGEVTITRRGRPVASLGPVSSSLKEQAVVADG